jgi:hypothetical protein
MLLMEAGPHAGVLGSHADVLASDEWHNRKLGFAQLAQTCYNKEALRRGSVQGDGQGRANAPGKGSIAYLARPGNLARAALCWEQKHGRQTRKDTRQPEDTWGWGKT